MKFYLRIKPANLKEFNDRVRLIYRERRDLSINLIFPVCKDLMSGTYISNCTPLKVKRRL